MLGGEDVMLFTILANISFDSLKLDYSGTSRNWRPMVDLQELLNKNQLHTQEKFAEQLRVTRETVETT